MLRALFFVLAPLLTAVLAYFFGWWALVGCVALVICTLLFSSAGEHELVKETDPASDAAGAAKDDDDKASSLGPATGF